ncbi:MAG: cysteine desulfurase [Bdellovibrionaceae bacterium]|nr:cysteine desulfurase [Pseudobdellovibrionaceae bacterium]
MTKIYLDHAATTPMRPAVRKRLHQLFGIDGVWANSSSKHSAGAEASAIVEHARSRIAALIEAKTNEIYFTGSATESNNWLLATAREFDLVTAVLSTEHSSLLAPLQLDSRNVLIPVDRDGQIQISALESILQKGTIGLVSVGLVNNEIGTIQDLERVATLCRKHRALLHTDAAQALGHAVVSVEKLGVDYMTLSSHKAGGPKGVAALYARSGSPLRPLLIGGGHERGLRSGTVAVELIDSFALAAESALKTTSLSSLREHLIKRLHALDAMFGLDISINGPSDTNWSSPHIVSLTIPSVHSTTFVEDLNRKGVLCSAGAACKASNPSGAKDNPVLVAMGRDSDRAHHIRLSIGHTTSMSEIDIAIERLEECLIGFGKVARTK